MGSRAGLNVMEERKSLAPPRTIQRVAGRCTDLNLPAPNVRLDTVYSLKCPNSKF